MTTFDGVRYRAPAITRPSSHYPTAAATATTLRNSVQSSYYAAQHRSRLFMQQTYGLNRQDYGVGMFQQPPYDTGYFRIAEGRAFVPEATASSGTASITHVVANILFQVSSPRDITVYHRLSVTDGTLTAQGSISRTVAEGTSGSTRQFGIWQQAPTVRVFESAEESIAEQVEVDVTDTGKLTAEAVWQVRVEAYAVWSGDASGAVVYMPQHVSCSWEVRY